MPIASHDVATKIRLSSFTTRWLNLIMTPALIVYILPAAIYALLFHFFWGRGYGQLALYCAASLLGFAAGAVVARILQSSWLSLGDVPVLEGSLGAVVTLLLARRLLM